MIAFSLLLSWGLAFLRLNALTMTIGLAIARYSEWSLEKRENLSAPRPQRLLDCVTEVRTSLQTSGSLSFSGTFSCFSFRGLDVAFRNFDPVSQSDAARFCALERHVARSAGFSLVST